MTGPAGTAAPLVRGSNVIGPLVLSVVLMEPADVPDPAQATYTFLLPAPPGRLVVVKDALVRVVEPA
jgi:hypothetical protein